MSELQTLSTLKTVGEHIELDLGTGQERERVGQFIRGHG